MPISRSDEKNNDEQNDSKEGQSKINCGDAVVKNEELAKEIPLQTKEEKDASIVKDTLPASSDTSLENHKIDGFSTRISIKNDPVVIDPGSSSFLYRSPYPPSATGYSNYPYPVPSIDSKDNPLSPSTINKKVTGPLLPVTSCAKDVCQFNSGDKTTSSFLSNTPKERDNFR